MSIKLTGQPNTLKRINVSLVKDALRLRGTATRRDLAEMTNLSQPTVNAIIHALLTGDEVVQRGTALSNGGRRAELYGLNHERLCMAALFVQPDHVEFAVIDGCDAIVTQGRYTITPTKSYPDQLCTLLNRLMDSCPYIRVAGIGLASAVSVMGQLYAAPLLPYLENCDLRQIISTSCRIPVTVENDVNMRALGYYRLELAQKTDLMVYLHLGTGLGAGLIIGGKVHRGFTNFGGEICYTCVDDSPIGGSYHNLEDALIGTTDDTTRIALLGRLAINIITLLNPPFLVLGGELICEEMLPQIRAYCAARLPGDVMPLLLHAKDETHYLLSGLAGSALECIDTELRLA